MAIASKVHLGALLFPHLGVRAILHMYRGVNTLLREPYPEGSKPAPGGSSRSGRNPKEKKTMTPKTR